MKTNSGPTRSFILSDTQWAAVRTYLLDIKEPPQEYVNPLPLFFLYCNNAIQGNSDNPVVSPSNILSPSFEIKWSFVKKNLPVLQQT